MPDKIIKSAIGELREEGERLDNPEARERLAGLVEAIENRAADEPPHGLVSDIREAVEQFEVEHPRITDCLNRIMVALSNMGI